MKALSMNTFQRGPIGAGASMASDRLVSIAAIAFGVLLAASLLIFASSAMLAQGTQPDLGSFAPAVPSFDDQFDPLEIDLYTQSHSNAYVRVDTPFDPL